MKKKPYYRKTSISFLVLKISNSHLQYLRCVCFLCLSTILSLSTIFMSFDHMIRVIHCFCPVCQFLCPLLILNYNIWILDTSYLACILHWRCSSSLTFSPKQLYSTLLNKGCIVFHKYFLFFINYFSLS